MAVTYDVTGPGSSGSTTGTDASRVTAATWTHVMGTVTNGYLVVGVSLGGPTAATCTATYNGVAMTQLGTAQPNTVGTGLVFLFGLASPASGSHSVAITSSAAATITGGSMSFAGVLSVGTAVTAVGAGTAASVSVTGTTTGNMIAAHAGAGSSFSTQTQTFRYRPTGNGATSAGNSQGTSAAGTGGTVAMGNTVSTSDDWAVVAVELKATAGSGTTYAGAATLAAVSSASFSGPVETAVAGATLAGSSGMTAGPTGVLGAAATFAATSGTTANTARGLAAACTTGSTSGMSIGTPSTGIGMVFSATSGLTATAGAIEVAQAVLAGTSGTTAQANLAAQAQATLAAVSGMSIGPIAIERAAATFTSTSGSTFTAQVTMAAAATTGNSSGTTVTALVVASVSATFSATSGSSFTAGWPIAPGNAVLSSVSTFSAQGALVAQAHSIFAGVSTLTIDGDKYTPAFIRPGGPVVRPVKTPKMRLLVANTMTGRVNYELPWDTLTWNSPLNAAGTMNAEIVVEAMLDSVYQQGEDDPAAVLREFLTGPWRWSLAVAYGNDVLWAGPYLPSQDPPDKSTVTIQGVQLEKMFDRRLVYGGPAGDVWNVPGYDLKFTGATLPGLVYSLIENAITPNTFSPNRGLPITCANPPAMVGQEQRTYYAYDLATTSKAISDIVTADGGPDWRLDPYLVQGDDGNYLRWELRVGNPTIDIAPVYTWDDTLALIQRDIDASAMATSVWVPGNGQDRDKVVGWESVDNTPFTLSGRGFPSLEVVDGNHSSETDFRKLVSWATANLASGSQAVDTWTLKVPVDGDPPAGAYRAGDVTGIDIARHRAITPGSYRRRITQLSGDGSTFIQIVCGDSDAALTG